MCLGVRILDISDMNLIVCAIRFAFDSKIHYSKSSDIRFYCNIGEENTYHSVHRQNTMKVVTILNAFSAADTRLLRSVPESARAEEI